jgi:signal transduction histidine kinase
MQGFSNILLEECQHQLSTEHLSYLRKIHSGAGRLDRLIQDVLTYSLISRSKYKLQPIDLDLLVRDIIEQYPGFQLPEADIQIEGTLPKVMANEATLTQCVSNLLGNAVKFVAPDTTPRVHIRSEPEGCDYRICFTDNGIGISPVDLERIFGIFVKVHPANTYSGTGIGLSIVRKAAEKMGGKVGVTSKLGRGSCFWLHLKKAL